jgi:hypothetical protein
MKNLFLVIAIATFFCLNACCQSAKEVPVNVKSAFSQKFPAASKVKWGKENDNEWEAEFKLDGRKYSANFDNNGTWMETEYAVTKKEIPDAVKASLEKEFVGYKIEESEISETAEGKVYEFAIEKGKSEMEVSVDEAGKIIKKQEEKEEDDD